MEYELIDYYLIDKVRFKKELLTSSDQQIDNSLIKYGSTIGVEQFKKELFYAKQKKLEKKRSSDLLILITKPLYKKSRYLLQALLEVLYKRKDLKIEQWLFLDECRNKYLDPISNFDFNNFFIKMLEDEDIYNYKKIERAYEDNLSENHPLDKNGGNPISKKLHLILLKVLVKRNSFKDHAWDYYVFFKERNMIHEMKIIAPLLTTV